MSLRCLLIFVALTVVAGAVSAIVPDAWADPVAVDLRVDADRDGVLTAADEAGEEEATVDHGALVLANVDDDGGRCAVDLERRLRARVKLVDITACHDGADDVVDGADDALDLAPAAVAPIAAPVTISATGPVHVFVQDAAGRWSLATDRPLDATDGLRLGVEVTDIVRDPARWDGTVRLTATAPAAAPDTVALRTAPLLALDATRRARTVLADTPRSRASIDRDYRSEVRRNLRLGRDRATARARARGIRAFALGQRAFLRGLDQATGVKVRHQDWAREWVQDAFESTYQSVPAAGGRAQAMRVALMAGTPIEPAAILPTNPLVAIVAGVTRNLRGADSGVVQHLPEGRPTTDGWTTTGTMEATPPVPGAPRGRLIVGGRGQALPAATAALVAAQGGAQPLLQLSTGWLDVGHTDETLAFVPARTARGWVAVVADPRGALDLLGKLPGDTPVLGGLRGLDGASAATTARAVTHGRVAAASRFAAERIDEQLTILRRELELTDADVVRVPVLYGWKEGHRHVVAFTGNAVNGLAPGGRRFLAPDPHVAAFREATRRALAAKGVATRFVDTWPLPHLGDGELHCMTNALRDLGDARWWG
ncbi:MAG TPA: protein-arginine deiminase family protein [Baekduia sp.]|uniref:protein-arginine deiminase family protein n=1 Tax=Baekduia sp. TaxID=2600305 RepID=UPI002D79D51F|nr:protein-arginine deiminase family protein [Baekduia sp.]HET6508475.1 protein-arginine deiminase family protein [Baekduia sp.]